MSEGEEGRLWCVERRGERKFEWESEEEMRGVSGNEEGVKDINLQWCQHRVLIEAHCFGHNFLLKCWNSKPSLSKFSPACALQFSMDCFCWFGHLGAEVLKILFGVIWIMSCGPFQVELWGCLQSHPYKGYTRAPKHMALTYESKGEVFKCPLEEY